MSSGLWPLPIWDLGGGCGGLPWGLTHFLDRVTCMPQCKRSEAHFKMTKDHGHLFPRLHTVSNDSNRFWFDPHVSCVVRVPSRLDRHIMEANFEFVSLFLAALWHPPFRGEKTNSLSNLYI